MNYETLNRLEDLMKYQIKFLDYIAELIEFDNAYASNNPTEELPPIKYLDELQSHFSTQKKACEAVLSITVRHLPRLKAEHEKNRKQNTKATTAQQTNKKPKNESNSKPPTKPPQKDKKQPEPPDFISLF